MLNCDQTTILNLLRPASEFLSKVLLNDVEIQISDWFLLRCVSTNE